MELVELNTLSSIQLPEGLGRETLLGAEDLGKYTEE